MRRAPVIAFALLAACGARTGLLIPDASSDASDVTDVPPPPDITDVSPPPDVCVPVRVSLFTGHAEVLFVLDASSSMTWSLRGTAGDPPSRWTLLNDALRVALPRYDSALDMGLLVFPVNGTVGDFCGSAIPGPQLAPRSSNAGTILAMMSSTLPGGRTPTAVALDTARRYFTAQPASGRVRAVVLATDGAPNCNASLNGETCSCTDGSGSSGPTGACATEPRLCLDDARTVTAVTSLASDGIPTYVIGLDGDPDPALTRVLTTLATAGGRPNPLDPTRAFYSVQRGDDITAAFDRIQRSIVGCALTLASPVPSDRDVTVTLDGAVIAHDPTRSDGWEWSDDAHRSISLNGPTCASAQMGTHTLELTAECPQ